MISSDQAMDIYPFSDPAQQILFNKIIHELRCSVCQNQNLANSMAPLAIDLRAAIYKQVLANFQEQAIVDFVSHRYGSFVLYDPPMAWSTALLWGGPLIMLCVVLICLKRLFRPSPHRGEGGTPKRRARSRPGEGPC